MAKKYFIENNLYKKIVESMPIPAVDVLLFSPDLKKVLLFLRNNNPAKGQYYSLGGRLGKGEDFIGCAKRKLKEESGIDESSDNFIFVDIQNEFFSNCFFSEDISSHFVNVYYALVCKKEMEISLDNQHTDYKWVDIADLSLNNYIKIKIRKSLKAINKNGKKF